MPDNLPNTHPIDIAHATILDTLPMAVTVLDSGGRIRYRNAGWHALLGEASPPDVGADYLSVYEALFGASDIDTMAMDSGLREVLAGERDGFEIEFPSDLGERRRWFVAQVLPYKVDNARGALVVHRDTTRRRTVEAQLHESEAELRALFAAMTDVIFVIDAQGRYLKVGPTSSSLLNRGTAHLLGKTFHESLPAAQADAFLNTIRQALARQRTVNIEYSMASERGELWFAAAVSPLDETRVLWVARDITESKHAAADIEQLKRRQDLLLNSAGEGIYGLDADGCTTFVNPVAARMLGYEVEELIGKPQHPLIHHSRPDGSPFPREECPIYAALRDGAVHHISNEVFWRKDGTSFPVEYISTPLRENGAIVGAVVTFQDITARREAEAERQRQEEIIRAQAVALLELSTPLIPLNRTTLLMPLIGALDSRRAQQVVETLLQGISEHSAQAVILDITGVTVVDTHVAAVLIQAAQAVRLLGARVILTGIRPEVAQAIVGLGVDLGTLETRATLQDGIGLALRSSRI